jgi:hypothetical protein
MYAYNISEFGSLPPLFSLCPLPLVPVNFE